MILALEHKMSHMLLLLGLIVAALCPSHAAFRVKRQYDSDTFDPVTGALLAECTFYGDQTVDCTGRLRCHPSDIEDRTSLAILERSCAREPSQKSGTWDRDQVIPASMMRNAGTGRVAKCSFYANHGSGNFVCVSTQGDNWKGKYTGTMNTAFKLGLPLVGSQSPYPSGSLDGIGRGNTGSLYPAGSVYPAGGVYGSGDRDRYSTDSSYYARTTRYPAGSVYNRDQDNYDGRGGYSTGLGLGGSRDSPYSSARDRDNSATASRDRYPSAMASDSYPVRGTANPITMCTYTNDGTGKCRECTEQVDRSETDREIRTTRHYTCSGPQTQTRWTESNGVIPAGQRPEPYTSQKRVISTCIYRPDELRFECHGGSNDGSCGLTSDGYGAGESSLSRCLTGEKWSGTYRGSVY